MSLQLKLKEDDFKLFREGMALRKYQIELLFGSTHILQIEQDKLVTGDDYLIRATESFIEQANNKVEYSPMQFIKASPDIYEKFKNDQKLNAKELRELPLNLMNNNQIAEALRSGILKHDSRGYYIDPHGEAQLVLFQLEEDL